MPRGSLLEVMKGGLGFLEGHVRIDRSVVTVYQYPPNKETKAQSDAFLALVWSGVKLDANWKEVEAEDTAFEIVLRMGDLEKIRPGKLEPKDFDNLQVEPEDLGNAVGVEGNCFFFADAEAKFGPGWAVMKESLEKHGFKAAVLGKGIVTDFEGTQAHFKTQEGQPYVAKKDGKNRKGQYKKGDTVTSENLVCDRIQVFGYEVDKKAKVAAAGKAAGAAGASATKALAPVNGSAELDPQLELQTVLSDLSETFKGAVPSGKAVKRADFNKALTAELMRKRLKPATTKALMDYAKGEDFAGLGELTELFKVEGDLITLA